MLDSQKVIIALDGMGPEKALEIAQKLSGRVWGFKVNDLLFADDKIILKLKKFGHVFADAKLYDIPNTVSNSVKKLSGLGADIITVHTSGGVDMMHAAKAAAGTAKIIGVTVLTSMALKDDGEVVLKAREAAHANIDGIVCSGHELERLNKDPELKSLIKVVPGIRPADYKNSDDQTRTMTPEEAIKLGADHIVIGRPITSKEDPLKALQAIFERYE